MGRPHVMTAAERQRRGKLREVTHAGDVLVALERAGNVLAALERIRGRRSVLLVTHREQVERIADRSVALGAA